MDRPVDQGNFFRTVSNTIVLASALYLVLNVDIVESCSKSTQGTVEYIAGACGFESASSNDSIRIGSLDLPWSQDCAGHNALLVLLGIVAWTCCASPTWKLVIKLLATIPLAIFTNSIRVMLIATYRISLYPAEESSSIHYLLGLICAIPAVYVISGDLLRDQKISWIELGYYVSLMSLLSAFMPAPGGWVVAASAIGLLLPRLAFDSPIFQLPRLQMLFWSAMGVGIALLQIESFWLAWLLICPWILSWKNLILPRCCFLLVGTVPLFATLPLIQVAVMIGLLLQFRYFHQLIKSDNSAFLPTASYDSKRPAHQIALFIPLTLPFVAPILATSLISPLPPPPTVMKRSVADNGYQIRVFGQPNSIAMFWYGEPVSGRHHSVRNCLAFKGVQTRPIHGEPGTYCSPQMWIRECYFVGDRRISSYVHYAAVCFPPITSHGIHIVIQAPRSKLGQEYFIRESERLFQTLEREIKEQIYGFVTSNGDTQINSSANL